MKKTGKVKLKNKQKRKKNKKEGTDGRIKDDKLRKKYNR